MIETISYVVIAVAIGNAVYAYYNLYQAFKALKRWEK